MSLRRRTYRLRSVCIGVETNLSQVISRLDVVFGGFSTEAHGPVAGEQEATLLYRIIGTRAGTLVHYPDGQALSFDDPLDGAESVQWHMSQSALTRVDSRFALHAAGLVLPGSDTAALIVGPSGAGKTTLTRELLRRGSSLLSDEAVFLSFVDGKVTGFPRAIGMLVEPGKDSRKAYMAPSDLGVDVIHEPVTVGVMFLLKGFEPHTRLRPLAPLEALPSLTGQVYATAPPDRILARLAALAGNAAGFDAWPGPPAEAATAILETSASHRVAA